MRGKNNIVGRAHVHACYACRGLCKGVSRNTQKAKRHTMRDSDCMLSCLRILCCTPRTVGSRRGSGSWRFEDVLDIRKACLENLLESYFGWGDSLVRRVDYFLGWQIVYHPPLHVLCFRLSSFELTIYRLSIAIFWTLIYIYREREKVLPLRSISLWRVSPGMHTKLFFGHRRNVP